MEFTITNNEKSILLAQARETIKAELEKRKPSYPEAIPENSSLRKPCGAFVSLHALIAEGDNKINSSSTPTAGRSAKSGYGSAHRSLRGCIGRMTASSPLIETVRLMAKEAAFGDPRFPPLSREELDRCQIEISALSPMTVCSDPRSVKVGVHGLYLRRGGRSGVLLPQVPVEQGWDLDEYLEYICIKAGLPAGSHEAPDAELLTFTAVVFGEE